MRRTLMCFAAVLFCSVASAQVANDTCTTATVIGTGSMDIGFDNTGALTETVAPDDFQIGTNPGFCTSWLTVDNSNDIWYEWIAATNTTQISLCDNGTPTNTDTKLEIYSACPASLATLVACDDDGCDATTGGPGFNSISTFATTAGATYLIRVGSFTAGSTGAATMVITSVADGLTNIAGSATGDNYTITWTNPGTGAAGDVVEIDSNEPGVTNPVHTIAFPGEMATGMLLPANAGNPIGVTYTLRRVTTGGASSIPANQPIVFNPIAGDECITATVLPAGDQTVNYDSSLAQTSPDPVPGTCTSGGQFAAGYDADIWFEWEATAPFSSFEVTAGAFPDDAVFAVYDSCADAAAGNALDCEDRGTTGAFALPTTAGQTYIIRIGVEAANGGVGGPGVLVIQGFTAATNDTCATAVSLGSGDVTLGFSTFGATADIATNPDPAPCPSIGFAVSTTWNGDVWFTWTAMDSNAFISVLGQAPMTNPVHAVYASCADAMAGNAIDCEDRGNPNFFAIPTTIGQTYTIRVASDSTVTTNGVAEIEILGFGPAANDECATATAIGTGDQTLAVSTLGATTGLDPAPNPCPSHTSTFADIYDHDAWFSWIADEGLARISWEGTAGLTTPVVAIYQSCADALAGNAVDCEDRGNPSVFTVGTTIGQTYLIRVGGDSTASTAGGLGELIIETFPPAANDECLTATFLGTGNFNVLVDNGAGSTGGDPTCSIAGAFNGDVWYSWEAHTGAVDIIWTGNSITDPVVAFYDSCGNAALGLPLDCLDAGNPVTLGTFNVTVGDTYFVRVAHDAGNSGTGSLEIVGQQGGVTNLTCVNTPGPDDYDLSWMPPFGALPGETFVVNSDEPGVVNPIYSGVNGTDPNMFAGTLLPGNQGLTLAVTYTVEYTTVIGVGISECFVVFNPLPGDECSVPNAGGTGNQVIGYTLVGATDSPEPDPTNCGQTTNFNEDLWYEWTADWPQYNMAIVSPAPMTDDIIAIYENCVTAAANNPLACQDGGTDAEIDVTVNVGQTYIIRVGNDDGGVGPATLTISATVPPVENVVCGPTVGDSTTVQWDWPAVAMAGDTVEINSNEPGVTNPVLTVTYSGATTRTAPYNLSVANAGASLAVTIDIVFTTNIPGGGVAASDAVSCTEIFNPIAHDECVNPLVISGPFPIVSVTNLGAASISPEPDVNNVSCSQTTNFNEDGWYEWTATAENVSLSWTSIVMTDPNIAIYESCALAGTGTAVACNDRGTDSFIDTTLTIGQTYIIRVARDDGAAAAEGTLTIDALCFDLANFTATFDCVTQVVTLAWDEADNYSTLSLTANGVPTTTQPTPLGLGSANGQIETSPPLNTLITYELTATCPNTGTSIVSVTVDTATPTGAANLIISVEQATGLIDNTQALIDGLTAAGQTTVVITDQANACFAQLVADADNIWFTEGTFPADGDITVATGDALYNAVQAGKNVYMQGGDLFGFAHVANLFDLVDGVDLAGTIDGGDTLSSVQSFDATNATFGTDFPLPVAYTQDGTGNEFTDELAIGTAASDPGVTLTEVTHRNFPDPGETNFIIGLVNQTTSGAVTASASFEVAGFGTPADQNALVQLYLDAFGSMPPGDQFQRGDCNDDGAKNIADPVRLLNFLFPPSGTPTPLNCDSACDANDDGGLNIADAVAMLNVLFPIGPPIAWLAPDLCGLDPTMDSLMCPGYTNCP
ncbi:MAG: hypothetical protein AAF581_01470 [Planctomycetota bacterium]